MRHLLRCAICHRFAGGFLFSRVGSGTDWISFIELLDLQLHRVPTSCIVALEQMLERLLVRMDANIKTIREDMKTMQKKEDAKRDNQKRMEANRKTDREETKQEIRTSQEQIREEEEIRFTVNAWIANMKLIAQRRPPATKSWRRIRRRFGRIL